MENRTWQPVPGMPGAFVYPYVRRPDVLSANSYWIEFPNGRLLIDPGALPAQTDELRRALSERERGRTLPLLVCATHCHSRPSLPTSSAALGRRANSPDHTRIAPVAP